MGYPAASILGIDGDAATLVRAIERAAHATAEHCRSQGGTGGCGPLVVEVGVCDGGSSLLILAAWPECRLCSFTWPGSQSLSEDRAEHCAGLWAMSRLSSDARGRWTIIHADSGAADWRAVLAGAYGCVPVPSLVLIDGCHESHAVYADVRAALDISGAGTHILMHDWGDDGVRAGTHLACADDGRGMTADAVHGSGFGLIVVPRVAPTPPTPSAELLQ